MVRIRLFASPREAVGQGTIDVPVPDGATASEVLDSAVALHPSLARFRPALAVAVNRRIALPTDRVRATDEVAFLPPVSGGAVEFSDDLSIERALATSETRGAGAAVAFLGLARPDRGTERLEFEAYEDMAIVELRRIEEAARSKWGLLDVLIRHRLGTVPVGEPSILVLALAVHRREAFEAASWIMDRVKESVPVWKKEIGAAGSRWIHPEGPA